MVASIPAHDTFGLASDGSYVWSAGSGAIAAWSLDGTLLNGGSGDYSNAYVFGAPNELRIALGPAGNSVIELIPLSAGPAVTSPAFAGAFVGWFRDGAHFLTTSGTTVSVYAPTAALVEVVSPMTSDGLRGDGELFWNSSVIRRIGRGSVSPGTLSDPTILASATSVVVEPPPRGPSLLVVTPSNVWRMPIVSPEGQSIGAVASSPAGAVVIGVQWDKLGAPMYQMYDQQVPQGPWQSLACGGTPFSLAASETGIVAIAVSSGEILVFDVESGQFVSRIDRNAGHVELSADGTRLVAQAPDRAQYWPDRSIRAYSLPTAAETHVWPYSASQDPATNFYFARSGDRLLHWLGNSGYRGIITDLDGNIVATRTDQTEYNPLLSPSGDHVALKVGQTNCCYKTNIWSDTSLVATAVGRPMGWLDDDRLMVAGYVHVGNMVTYAYDSARVIDIEGNTLFSAPVPENWGFEMASPTEIYSPAQNAIFDLATGTATWTSANGGGDMNGTANGVQDGAIAGHYVVYRKGSFIFAEPF